MSTGKPTPRSKPADLDATVVGNLANDLGATVMNTDSGEAKVARSAKTAVGDELDATLVGNPGGDMDATYVTDDLAKTGKLAETGAMPKAAPSKTAASSSAAKTSSASKSAAMSEEAKQSKSVSQIGDYKIVKKLGKGGMGEVYLVHQISLDRTAALKVLSKQLAGKEDFVKRFYREARAMAKIDHPNAVRVYEVREDLGIHYVAMEYIDGKSMQKWMDELGKLTIGDAVHVTLCCAEALHAAHSQSMIHRDIKPDNIMLTSKGGVKVADFGLAKALDDENMSMTQSGTGLGTPYYMAPEQARNAKHVDGRADVYALGVTLYYFVTGSLPFTGNSTIEVIQNKEAGRFTSARKINPQVSERLELVISKMMMKDPDHRFKDCGEVIKALAALGLESPSLSFIDAPDKVVATASASRSITSTPQVSRCSAIPKSSAEDAAAKEKPISAAQAADLWFVQYKDAQGKEAMGKFSTAQVLQMLKAGSLDPRSKAKKGATGTLLPLSQIAEFDKAAQSQMTRINAQSKSEGLKKQFAQIDRQDKWWKIKKKIFGFFSGAVGLVKFVIWMAVVFGGIGAVILFRAQIWDFVANKINSAQPSAISTEKPAEKPAQ